MTAENLRPGDRGFRRVDQELQNLTRETQGQIQQIWQRIQEILVELRNRFPGNGRG